MKVFVYSHFLQGVFSGAQVDYQLFVLTVLFVIRHFKSMVAGGFSRIFNRKTSSLLLKSRSFWIFGGVFLRVLMEYPEKLFIQKLDHLIHANLSDANYSIDAICLELGISRSQLFRLVKEQTGLSTSLYIRQLRMNRAGELLGETSLRISEIMLQVGIESPQNFTKYFTEKFGISPTQYRKIKAENASIIAEEPTLEAESPNELLPTAEAMPLEPPPVSRLKRRWGLGVGIMILLLGLMGGLQWYVSSSSSSEAYSLAVLPFKNMGNKASDYFCEGVTDQIHSSLVLLRGLKVISKNSSHFYSNTSKSTQVIGRELGVSHLIGGTVWQLGNKIRITIQLVDVAKDQTVWSQSYDGQTADIFTFIGTLSKKVAAELQQKLSLTQRSQLDRVPTRNPEAYNAYLQGMYLVSTRSKEKLEASVQKFEEAIALDPTFSDAYAHQSEAYFSLGNLSHIPLDSSLKLTEQAALAAIRLDSQNGLAYALLASVYRDRYQWEQANTTYQIALKHSPNNALVMYWYSLMLRNLGMLQQATQYSTMAVELDPLSPVIMSGHIRNCSYSNNQSLLKEALQKGELLFSNSFLFYWSRGYHYLHEQRYTEALADLQKSQKLTQTLKGVDAAIAYTQARLGDRVSAQAYLTRLPSTPENLKFRAIALAGLRDKEGCLQTLEAMAAQGEIPTDLKVSPFFQFLQNPLRLQAVLRQFNLLTPPSIEIL